jgi:hypothetical protein
MADQNPNPVGCLGRALTFIGVFWIGIVLLAGLGLFSEFGFARGFLAGIGGSIIPGVFLLAAGRALRRRARAMGEETPVIVTPTGPTTPGKRVPTTRTERPETIVTPPVLPGQTPPTRPVPRQLDPLPPPTTPTRNLEEVIPPPESEPEQTAARPAPPPTRLPAARPKTSRELVEEARQKWGRKSRRPGTGD